jgi:hypothetical protein
MEILQGIDSLLHSSQAFQCPLLFAHPGLHILGKDLVLLFLLLFKHQVSLR